MPITALPTAPARSQAPATFIANADAWVAALSTFVTEVNAQAAAMNSAAAGTAFSIPYIFSTTTTDSDPGAGVLRLDNATQNTATTIRADLVGSDTTTWTSVLDTFDDSTSTIKGQIRLVKSGDAAKWLAFNVTALASPSGYKNITVANVASSAASPFADGDALLLSFTRTGDLGAPGTLSGTTTAAIAFNEVDKGTNSTPGATVTFDVSAANVQKLTIAATTTLALSNIPASGTFWELLIKLTNGGSSALTLPTINWQRPAGGYTTTFATYLAETGRPSLQSAEKDFMYWWGDTNTTTIYGKLI